MRDLWVKHQHFIETTSGTHLLSVSGGSTVGLGLDYRAATSAPKGMA